MSDTSSHGPLSDRANLEAGKPKDWSSTQALGNAMSQVDREALALLFDYLQNEGRYRHKELAQKWEIAQLGEQGANKRAGISAAASRYAASQSAAASRYGADRSYAASVYGADRSLEGVKYRTDADRETEFGSFGLGYLTAASQMRGPENYLQQSDFLRGASARQDVPIFIQNLMRGVNGASFQAPGGAPQGATVQGLIGSFTGGNADGGTGPTGQDASFLQAVRSMAAKGLHTLAPQALESLTPSELGALRSAIEYSGDGGTAFSFDDAVRNYTNSRIGQ